MKAKRQLVSLILIYAFTASAAFAQNPEVLPKPEQPFTDAKIGRTYKDSKPGTITLTKAPEGAPNVFVVLIDDAGFGQWGTFGGQVPTPNLDRVAKMGLRYTRSIVGPACRALITFMVSSVERWTNGNRLFIAALRRS